MTNFKIRFSIKQGSLLYLNKEKEFGTFSERTLLFKTLEEAEFYLDALDTALFHPHLALTIEKVYLVK